MTESKIDGDARNAIWAQMASDGLPLLERKAAMFLIRCDVMPSLTAIKNIIASPSRPLSDKRIALAVERAMPYIRAYAQLANQDRSVSA